MCGRFWIDMSVDLYDRYDVEGEGRFAPDYNVSPGKTVPIVHMGRIIASTWGFPSRGGGLVINARMEGLEERPMFERLLEGGRCIVPVSGFYEWVSAAGRRVPYNITTSDGSLLSLAGLCDTTSDDAPFVIITTDAKGDIGRIHDRMPVILPRSIERDWLRSPFDEVRSSFDSFDVGGLTAFPVSSMVNDPRNEGAGLIRPVGLF